MSFPQGQDPGRQPADLRKLALSRRQFLKYGALGVGVGAALSACGSSSPTTPGSASKPSTSSKPRSGTLSMWTWAGGAEYQAGLEAVVATYPKDFKGVTVKVETPVTGDFQMAEKLTLALSGHTPLPDLVQLNYTELNKFATAGVLANVNSFFPSSLRSNLYKGADAICNINGTYYAFPHQVNAKLFYYRADLFKEANIDVEAIETLDDFIAAGHKFTAKFPGQYIMNVDTQPPEYFFGETVSAFAPVEFVNKKGVWDITSNPAFLKTFEFLRELHTSGIAYPVDDFTAGWPEAIAKERICGFLIADWMKDFLPQYAGLSASGKWKARFWPTFEPTMADERYGSDAGGSILVVFDEAPNKDLALEVAQRASLDEVGSMAFFKANGTIPLLRSMKSEVLSYFKTATKPASMSATTWGELPQNYLGQAYYEKEFDAYDYVKIFGFSPASIEIWGTILEEWMDKSMSGTLSPAAALAGMQHACETQIGNPYKSVL